MGRLHGYYAHLYVKCKAYTYQRKLHTIRACTYQRKLHTIRACTYQRKLHTIISALTHVLQLGFNINWTNMSNLYWNIFNIKMDIWNVIICVKWTINLLPPCLFLCNTKNINAFGSYHTQELFKEHDTSRFEDTKWWENPHSCTSSPSCNKFIE